MSGQARIGVDIGGTFTDVALEIGTAQYTTKVLTTQAAPERGVMDAVARVLAEARLAPGDVGVVIHGTTLATNAIIERKGARTALLTTDGFRDTLQIASESRFEVYDVELDLPEPLVARDVRLEVRERMSARGDVLLELREDDVRRIVEEQLIPRDIESVAVAFVHAYANPAHELRVQALLRERLPELAISLSHEVSPEMREYERFSTTVANAYVQPLMSRYLISLERELGRLGVDCPLFLMTSGGGLTTLETALRFPVRLVESGPAGGALFAGHIARQRGLDRVLSFDMGGTTAKICLVDDGASQTARAFEVARMYRFKKGSGLPLRIPVIEMIEIGAGGGSIARIDALGRLAVGPDSAGAEPGPACYDRGGTEPTVTDADLLLGRIDPERFAGGRIRLDAAAASEALARHIATPLGVEVVEAAYGVAEMVDTNMANAARVHAIESGKALEERTIIAFGGAAPLHVARVAELLGVRRILVPTGAGVGSSVGFLRAPVGFEIVRSFYQHLGHFNTGAVNAVLREMAAQAAAEVRRAAPAAQLIEKRLAYIRYAGQGSEILVALPSHDLPHDAPRMLKAAFEEAYLAQFTHLIPRAAAEVVSWSVTVSAPAPEPEAPPAEAAARPVISSERRRLFDPAQGEHVEFAVFWRPDLAPGATFEGPALVAEEQTTSLVPAGYHAHLDGHGHLEITRR
jgi:N-methylhydantoinase A